MTVRASSLGLLASLSLLVIVSSTALPAQTFPSPNSEAPIRPEITVRVDSSTVSAELLRYPLTQKARSMLLKALETMKSGDHMAAISQLLETLSKYPGSAAYVHSLLGVEYLRTDQFRKAADSFEQAVVLLPHDAVNRYNLGLSLVCAGDYERGEQEVQRAADLSPRDATIRKFLNALLSRDSSDGILGKDPSRYPAGSVPR